MMYIKIDSKEIRAIMWVEHRSKLGATLYLARIKQSLDISKISKETGYPEPTLYKIEKNYKISKQEKLQTLERAYNVIVDEDNDFYKTKLTYRNLFWDISKIYNLNENQTKLYVYMKYNKLTYEKIGKLLNISKQAVYYLLNNEAKISDEYISLLEEYVDVTDIDKPLERIIGL